MPKVKKQSAKTKSDKVKASIKEKMQNEEFKEENRERAAKGMRFKRETDVEFAELQKAQAVKILETRKKSDPKYAAMRNKQSAKNMKEKRKNDPDFASLQKKQSAQIMKSKLECDPEFANKQRISSVASKREKRKVVEKREEEKEKDRLAKQALKEERDKKKQEKAKKVAEQRELRMNSFYKYRESFTDSLNETKLNRNGNHTPDEINSAKRCLKFISEIREVPSRVCCCCEGLFFKNYTKLFDSFNLYTKYNRKMRDFVMSGKSDRYDRKEFSNASEFIDYITGYDSGILCLTCFKNLENGRIPLINPHCGINVPEIPKEIEELTDFMERLVSPILALMQIRELQPYAINPQLGIKGAVINFIPRLQEMLQVLPRTFNETSTIQLKLKRHMTHKTDYMHETFSVPKLMKALAILIKTPLYQEYKIEINEKAFEEYDPECTGTQVNFVMEDGNLDEAKDDNNVLIAEKMDVDEDFMHAKNVNPQSMQKSPDNEKSPMEIDVDMVLRPTDETYNFRVFRNSLKTTCFNVSNFQFTLLCAFNSVFHGFNTSYRLNEDFHRLMEDNKDLIDYFKLISEISYLSDEIVRNKVYIDFLCKKSFAGLKIDDKDKRNQLKNMEYDSAIILENFLSLDGISTLLPSYRKYARCSQPDCNGVSYDYVENSLIYVQLNENESLNMYIGDKVRIATNTISESDIPFTCDKCKSPIKYEKTNSIRCMTEYNDILIMNIQSIKQNTFSENIMELDPFNDIPFTFHANKDEYQLLFFINKGINHYTSYYYKTQDEIILVDDMHESHDVLHRSDKYRKVNPSIIVYFKKPKKQDDSMDISFDAPRSKDINLQNFNSDDISALKELFSALDIGGGYDSQDPISNVNTEMMEEIENEELLYDGKDELPPDNNLEELLMLKDINVDDALDANLETDVLMDKSIFMKDHVKIIAPGQGKIPVPSQNIPNYDELCFPKTYGGHKMTYDRKKISYTRVIRAELKHYKRKRCRPVLVLFKLKEKYKRDVRNRISIAIRKGTKGRKFTAKDVRDGKGIDDHIKNNLAYRLLSTIRSSPMYFRKGRTNALAMLNQLNYPTIFFTCSMAESFSPELLQQMHKNIYGKEISLLEALKMTPAEKAKLVREDPVSCAEFFNHRLNSLGTFAGDTQGNGLLGKNYVTNFIRRKEAQGRGTMHSHQIWWCKDAPRLNIFEQDEKLRECNEKEVTDFIDETISTEYIEDHPNIHFHVHNCGQSCYKGKKGKVKKCRFNFPHFVSNKTKIIYPIPQKERTEKMMQDLIKIREKMKHYKKTRELQSFEDMLEELDMNETDYFNAVRCAYKRIDVLYKRESNAVNINTYIKKLLDTWEGNHDAQYIPDPYGFVYYLSKYCLKADEGMLDMMRRAGEECKEGNKTVLETLGKIAGIFLGSSFIGAQQAVEEILGFAILKFSNAVFFINTNRPEKRIHLRKSKAELEKMDDDDEDIMIPGFIAEYENRPKNEEMDKLCLADFAALYKREGEQENVDEEDYIDDDDDDDDDNRNKKKKWLPKKYVKRTRERIIRHVGFKKEMNEEEYYREMVMLFLPWRNEENEILNADTEEIFNTNKIEILEKYARYNSIGPEKLKKLLEEVDENLKDLNEEEIRKFYELEEVDAQLIPNIDVFEELGINRNVDGKTTAKEDTKSYVLTKPSKINPQELYENMRRLNEKQQIIVQHVYHIVKTRDEEFDGFPKILLLGPAGTGKSLVLRTIYQLLTHFYDFTLGENEDSTKVLLAAYTGVAAFLIGGNTCHNAFCLKVGFKGRSLDDEGPKNNIRSIHRDVQAIIIDECSFISRETRKRIDLNCRKIYGNNRESFGGKLVMFIGDLFQLAPVCGLPIYKTIEDFDSKRIIDPHKLMEEINTDVVWDEFKLFELTEIVRQKNVKYQIALNNLAKGKLTEDDLKLINERVFKDESLVPIDTIRLYYTNKDVMRYNLKKIKELKGTLHEVQAIDEIRTKNSSEKIKGALLNEYLDKQISDAEYKSISSTNLRSSIPVKLGIKYMIIVNIDVSDGLVNGAFGTCEDLTFGKDKSVLILWVNFNNPKIGGNMRMPYIDFMKKNNIPLYLVPIVKVTHEMTATQEAMKKLKYKVLHEAFRTQFPVTPCEAMTIHKTQGLTIPKVCLDFSNCDHDITTDLKYVAMSRCDFDGLYILGEFKAPTEKSARSAKRIVEEIERFRTEAPLELSFYNFEQNCGKKIIYHNVSSFNLHKIDILCIDWYWKADVLIFSEVNVDFVNEKTDVRNGFTVLYPTSKDQQLKERSRGLVILCKDTNDIRKLSKPIIINDDNEKWQLDLRTFEIEDHYIITGYKSPKTPYDIFEKEILALIQEKPDNLFVTIIGDFNFNLRVESKFRMYLVENNFINHLNDEITRDQRTQVDIVVSTSTKGRAGNFASYFSDHFAIFYQTEYDFDVTEEIKKYRQRHKKAREAAVKQNKTNSKSKKNQVGKLKVKEVNVSKAKNVIFQNSILAMFEKNLIEYRFLCPYNAVFHGFTAFFNYDDEFKLIVNENMHIPFYKLMIEALSKTKNIRNNNEQNQLWLDFILMQCSKIVKVTPNDVSKNEKDMRNDLIEVLRAFFNDHISVLIYSDPCNNITNEKQVCTGSSSNFVLNVITLFDMDKDLKNNLQDRVFNCARSRFNMCLKCRLSIDSSNYNPVFGNFIIIDLTFSNESMDANDNKEARVEVAFTDIPSELYLNGECFQLKLIFDHPSDHFTSYYHINDNKLLLLDDLKGEKTFSEEELKVLGLNVKALVFVKISKKLSKRSRKIEEENDLLKEIQNTKTKKIKLFKDQEGEKEKSSEIVEKIYTYVIFRNTFEVKLNENYTDRLTLMCTFNSFFHGFSTSCRDESFNEYIVSNLNNFSFFNVLLRIFEKESQSIRNQLWYLYLKDIIPDEDLNANERSWPFRLMAESVEKNVRTKSFNMVWNQEDLIDHILKDFESYSWQFECSQCDYQKFGSMRCHYTNIIEPREFKHKFQEIFLNRIKEKHALCKNCKIQLSNPKISFGEVLMFSCRFGTHSQVEIPLSDIPSVVHLGNNLIYDLKFVVNYDNDIAHFNCFTRLGQYFIFIDDLGPNEATISPRDFNRWKINPCILVFFKNVFTQ